jgi:hypothetical protein
MKRTNGTTRRTKLTVAGLFLMVALASAGCSGNALMNPQMDKTTTTGQQTAQGAGHNMNPTGHTVNP